jgi:EAL domain-containing protein (putative c-di-GMP-specific phosphodiesterase class I)/GGDEF domain-containing protein
MIAVIIQIMLSVVYLIDMTNNAYKQYEDYCLLSVQNSAYKIERYVIQSKDDATNFNYQDLSSSTPLGNFDFIVKINSTSVVSFISKKEMSTLNINPGYYSKLMTEGEELCSLALMVENQNNDLAVAISKKTDDDNYMVYIKDVQSEVNLLLNTGFTGVVLSSYSNVALFSNISKYNDVNLVDTLPFNISEYGDKQVVNTDIDGVRVTLALYNLGQDYNNVRFIGYLPSTKVQEFVSSSSYKFTMIVLNLLIVSTVSLILSILSFIKKYKSITIFTGVYPNLFSLVYDKKGKLLSVNSTYKKEFGRIDALKNLCYKGDINSFLINRQSFTVKLIDVRLKTRYLTFVAKNGLSTIKLIGGESTSFIEEYNNYKKISETDEITGLKDHNELKKQFDLIHNGMFIMISLLNLSSFKSLFGDAFYNNIIKFYANELSNEFMQYGVVYSYKLEQFVLLVKDPQKCKEILSNIEKIMTKINTPITIKNNVILVDCRAGIVDIDDKRDFEKTIECAESTVHQASQVTKAKFSIYRFEGENYINYSNPNLIKDMIDKNELAVYFQPQYSLKENKIIGFEALTRILDKNINIERFVQTIENKGFMIELGEFIFNSALEFAKSIQKYNVEVSLNISGVQFMQMGFTEYFINKYKSYKIKKGLVNVEVTESFLLNDIEEATKKLNIIKENGINIHLDDFGIAYSSFLYLKKLPVNTIKFDMVFIKDIQDNETSRVMISNLINMCKELHIKTIAEGVELEKQKNILTDMGCDTIQGFLIGRAVPKEEALKLIFKYNNVGGDVSGGDSLSDNNANDDNNTSVDKSSDNTSSAENSSDEDKNFDLKILDEQNKESTKNNVKTLEQTADDLKKENKDE